MIKYFPQEATGESRGVGGVSGIKQDKVGASEVASNLMAKVEFGRVRI